MLLFLIFFTCKHLCLLGAKLQLPDYNTKNILIFGLGKMGKYACKNLAEYTQNKQITLINRTEEKVTEFVKEIPFIKKGSYQNLSEEIAKSEVLIVSTGSNKPTITKQHIPNDKEILILDLSMPANVSDDVKLLPNTTVINVDVLSKVTDETLEMRKREIPLAEAIIEEHKAEFYEWLNHRRFTPTINTLKKLLETIKQNEIAFHKKKVKNFDEKQAEAITSRFIQKITTLFVKHLKDENTSIPQSIEVMSRVFDTEIEE